MVSKSPEAFRTISEVAGVLDVPPHVLRFWETRFSQVKPVKRGGGRRYYRPEDVNLLRGIRGLLYEDGLTIKGAQKVLREKGVRHVIALGAVDEPDAPVEEKPKPKKRAASKAKRPQKAPAPVEELLEGEAPQPDLFSGDIEEPTAQKAEAPEKPARDPERKAALAALVAKLQDLRAVMADDAAY